MGVQHVLSQFAVLGVSRGAQQARKVLLPAAFESQVLHQVVPHLIRSIALMAIEDSVSLGELAYEIPRRDRWKICKRGMIS